MKALRVLLRVWAWLGAQRVLFPQRWTPRGMWTWFRSESKLDAFCRATGLFCLIAIPVPNLLRAFTESPWYGLLVPYGLFLGWYNLRAAEQGDRKTRRHREFMTEMDRINGMIAEYQHLDPGLPRLQQLRDIDAALKAARSDRDRANQHL